MSEPLQPLLERVSIPADMLDAPAPSGDDLHRILQAAVTAPDHAGLRPWRFITIRDDARNKLGEVFCQAALKKNPDLPPDKLDKIRGKPLRAPLIVAVAAAIQEHPKVSAEEQLLSAGACAQNILLAADALGYGGIWLTGDFAADPYVQRSLGLNAPDRIVGFLYLGTPSESATMAKKKAQRRPDPADYTRAWNG